MKRWISGRELIQIAWELVGMASSHALQFGLHTTPITLHMLSMDACHRLYE
ncbi:hypothetical protein GBAR_LOCUS18044, partial [Geodia barretti]